MEENHTKTYPLDSSAMVHLASMREGYTNTFRIFAALTRKVDPKALQRALDRISPRFPTIVAGIRRGIFQYKVVPVCSSPAVKPDSAVLAYMPEEMIRTCAMRVLYKEKEISVEFFHALTDGYGGLMFVQALLTEYLFQSRCISEEAARRNRPLQGVAEKRKTADDFITYAGEKTAPMNHRRVYCLPGNSPENQKIHVITKSYDLKEMLRISHRLQVSLTVFLTAVMAMSIVEIQTENLTRREYEPVQIMVPVNLRKRFLSASVRNFSLYALPCVEPFEFSSDLEDMAKHLDRQMIRWLSREELGKMISSGVQLQRRFPVRWVPAAVKEAVLRRLFSCFGEQNSCLTLSNLGQVTLPDEIGGHVEQIKAVLSPRRNAPYNCGVVSYKGRLTISFTRRGEIPGLEQIFFRRLEELDCR